MYIHTGTLPQCQAEACVEKTSTVASQKRKPFTAGPTRIPSNFYLPSKTELNRRPAAFDLVMNKHQIRTAYSFQFYAYAKAETAKRLGEAPTRLENEMARLNIWQPNREIYSNDHQTRYGCACITVKQSYR